MTLKQVIDSVTLQVNYVTDAVHLQNLAWSFQYIMSCLDADLRAFVLSKISTYAPEIGRSGPVAFMIVAQRMIQTTENLAQKVINGFIALRLTHFDGENVIECIFTLRNVLKFLRYGEANTFAPRTTIVLLFDVFRGSTVTAFRSYVQQAQDIVLKDETHPEVIFDHFQSKYEELLLADRWVPTKKKGSAFVAGTPQTQSYADAEKKKNGGGGGNNDQKRERLTHDRNGCKIDYTPPKSGEPQTRTRDGKEEHWCGKCGRWGSHLSEGHDDWANERKKARKAQQKKKADGANANTAQISTSNTSNNSRGSVTFVSALTGSKPKLAMDPELTDGIDL